MGCKLQFQSRIPAICIAALAYALPGAGHAAGTAVTAEACTTCHGPGGISQGAMPSLAGQAAADLRSALSQFRDGGTDSTIMGRLVGPLSDADIIDLADWFAALPGETR